MSYFKNEPFTDFSIPQHRAALQQALDNFAESTKARPSSAKILIGGVSRDAKEQHEREDPSNPSRILGTVHYATIDHVNEALTNAAEAQGAWAATPWGERTNILRRAAQLMRTRRQQLNAILISEVGKPWKEADGDVAEAIDFCDYYAEQAEVLGRTNPTSNIPGEENYLYYHPRGIAAVIAPWNFPLAIAVGMTVAALVCGNATILKPAEQSSLIAAAFAQILLEAGVPPQVFSLLPGAGEVVGAALVADPRVEIICFTGSRAVGLHILKSANTPTPNQRTIKKVIAELGGKNAIIVDEDADEDEAIRGILSSAFGFAGQKCSACSRLIVVGSHYDRFIARLSEAADDLILGPAADPSSFVGPVVDLEAFERIKRMLTATPGSVMTKSKRSIPDGYFIAPTIIKDPPLESDFWREEIFGPILCTRNVRTFEEALQLAMNSPYALTGGVYSRNPQHLLLTKQQFRVGNLYINRGITGALVGRQPFGGGRMSGVGSKAGGADYLLQFVEPHCITENTMRRGFVPEA